MIRNNSPSNIPWDKWAAGASRASDERLGVSASKGLHHHYDQVNYGPSPSTWGGTDVKQGDWSKWSGGPGGPVVYNPPISSLDREGRLTRMSREAGAPIPQDIMPPFYSNPSGESPSEPTYKTPTPSGLSRRDILNIAKNNGIPISSYHITLSDKDLFKYVKDQYEAKTGQQLAWM